MPIFEKRTLSEILSYIAGFIDGEGCFCFRVHESTRPVPTVTITQKKVE